jgi:hypothetical protein
MRRVLGTGQSRVAIVGIGVASCPWSTGLSSRSIPRVARLSLRLKISAVRIGIKIDRQHSTRPTQRHARPVRLVATVVAPDKRAVEVEADREVAVEQDPACWVCRALPEGLAPLGHCKFACSSYLSDRMKSGRMRHG